MCNDVRMTNGRMFGNIQSDHGVRPMILDRSPWDSMDNRYSEILFNRPSFLNGVGRTLDARGKSTHYNQSRSGAAADRFALRSDAKAISRDIEIVLDEVARPALAKRARDRRASGARRTRHGGHRR